MRVIDPGHVYDLPGLDGGGPGRLAFVKRAGPGYPGNLTAHPGTTSQAVMRALLDRLRYVQGQAWCAENWLCLLLMRLCLWLLEFRAARRHGRLYARGLKFAESAPTCARCGHTVCGRGCADALPGSGAGPREG